MLQIQLIVAFSELGSLTFQFPEYMGDFLLILKLAFFAAGGPNYKEMAEGFE